MSTEILEELKKKTVPQLRSYAKKNNIDIFGSNTKQEILEVILCWIPKDEKAEVKKKPEQKKKVAIHAARNLHWSGVGALKIGYNIVTKEESDKWLSHKAVRLATPEEVAKHYGKL